MSEQFDDTAEGLLRRIRRTRERNLVLVNQPLVLITQAPRSGGTLLMRLFDGHRQCHTIPHELGVRWAEALPDAPDAIWSAIADRKLRALFEDGFIQGNARLSGTRGSLPFLLPPPLHRRLFDVALREMDDSDRGAYNAYFTAYFNAWLDCQNLYGGDKRWITAFAPWLIARPLKLRRILDIYPDGRIISIIRDPASWYASASRWSKDLATPEKAIPVWRGSVEAALERADELGERMMLLRFDELVGDTKTTLGELCRWLGLRYFPELGRPTFNGHRVKANSSFRVSKTNVLADPLARATGALDAKQRSAVEALAGDAYELALARIASARSRIA